MLKLRPLIACIAVVAITLTTLVALADTVVLKDGREIEGSIMKIGRQYRVKTADGQVHMFTESEVKQVIRAPRTAAPAPSPGIVRPGEDDASATPAEADGDSAVGAATGKEITGPSPDMPAGVSGEFANVKRRADAVTAPILAVALWERFIDSKPSETDLIAAKVELQRWQELQKDEAEKIGGKWVGGKDRKELKKKVDELIAEGYKSLTGNQTVRGIAKLEEALKLYPDSFEANFELGYYYLSKGAIGSTGRGNVQYMEKAIKALERARDIRPDSAATWSNLSIAYNFRSKYLESVQAAYKAARIEDTKEVVENLVNSIARAPRGMQTSNTKVKPIMEDAIVLARKHGINLQGGSWHYIRPKAAEPGDPSNPGGPKEETGPPGVAWSGSGFFITPDGYLLTNHHVATGDPKTPILRNISFRVRMDDGTEKNAELIAVDDAADIALMKVKVEPGESVPYLKLADDNPKQASKALVLGYPATSMFSSSGTMSLQISEGQVKSINVGDEHEVWFDLNTTHGNSGGPIVDKDLRVVGILTAGRQVYNVWYVLGVGPNQIKKFFETIGDQAPTNAEWVPMGANSFDGVKLTEDARKSTLLIIAIRGIGDGTSDIETEVADEESATPDTATAPAP